MTDTRPYELELPSAIGSVAGQWNVSVEPRPIAAAGCCSRCGGATWQHQARDICGRCGHVTQHEVPKVRLQRYPA